MIERLPVELTKEEIAMHGQRLSLLVVELEKMEEDKRQEMKAWSLRINNLRDEINELAIKVRDGIEERDVEVTDVIDTEKGMKNIVRLDTMEVIDKQPLTDDDLQIPLTEEQADAEEDF